MPHKPLKAPAFIAPQVPVLSPVPPSGPGWIHEIKHDGFRTLIGMSGKDARAFTEMAQRLVVMMATQKRRQQKRVCTSSVRL
jgi:ATP-dependent DNA ligase